MGAKYDIDVPKISANIVPPYTSHVNTNLECALTATLVHACDKVNLNKPRMLSPSRMEFSYAENENEIETNRNMTSRPLARTHDIRNLSYEHEVKSRYYEPTEKNRLYPQQIRKCNYDVLSEIVPKRVDFVQNNTSSKQRNERKNYMSMSMLNQLCIDSRDTSSCPGNRSSDNIAKMVYNADQNGVALWQPQTDCDNGCYNDDSGLYMQQPYVIMGETTKNTFKFSGDKTQFAYFWSLYTQKT